MGTCFVSVAMPERRLELARGSWSGNYEAPRAPAGPKNVLPGRCHLRGGLEGMASVRCRSDDRLDVLPPHSSGAARHRAPWTHPPLGTTDAERRRPASGLCGREAERRLRARPAASVVADVLLDAVARTPHGRACRRAHRRPRRGRRRWCASGSTSGRGSSRSIASQKMIEMAARRHREHVAGGEGSCCRPPRRARAGGPRGRAIRQGLRRFKAAGPFGEGEPKRAQLEHRAAVDRRPRWSGLRLLGRSGHGAGCRRRTLATWRMGGRERDSLAAFSVGAVLVKDLAPGSRGAA